MNLCVNVYLDSVSAWIIVKLIVLLGLLRGHLLFIIINVSSGGTRFCIDMHLYTNVALENVLRATMIFLTVYTRIVKQVLGANTNDIIYTTSIWCLYFYVQ